MACFWKGTTSKGRILLVGKNDSAPTVAASEFTSCTNSGRNNRFGYPPPITSGAGGAFSAWCLDNDESVVSIESYDCDATAQKYDCLNGGCIPVDTYNTPGKYSSVAACLAACAKDSNCLGECVTFEDIAALEQAASNLQARYCK